MKGQELLEEKTASEPEAKTATRSRRSRSAADNLVDTHEVFRRLTAPFPAESVSFKPQTVHGNRALAVPYLDARSIMDRLDEVLGPAGWQDDYEPLQDGSVKCTLRLRIGGDWIAKSDVGCRSDQPDEGDRQKAAFSDALKRTSVKWGIGRYLYRLPKQWLGYDPQRREFTETPALPAWARAEGRPDPRTDQQPEVSQSPVQTEASLSEGLESPFASEPAASAATAYRPADGRGLFRWLKDQERQLVQKQLCRPGELIEHVARAGEANGRGTQIVRWEADGLAAGMAEAILLIQNRSREHAAERN